MSEKLPALSFEALGKIKEIEAYATSCMAQAVFSLPDTTGAIRDLRSCAGVMFHVYAEYYASLGYEAGWLLKIQTEITGVLSSAFSAVLRTQTVRLEVEDVIRQDFALAAKQPQATRQSKPMGQFTVADIDQTESSINQKHGYSAEVKAWMKDCSISSVEIAAKRLGVGYDTLKSIMSEKGKPRYSQKTLSSVLEKIAPRTGE